MLGLKLNHVSKRGPRSLGLIYINGRRYGVIKRRITDRQLRNIIAMSCMIIRRAKHIIRWRCRIIIWCHVNIRRRLDHVRRRCIGSHHADIWCLVINWRVYVNWHLHFITRIWHTNRCLCNCISHRNMDNFLIWRIVIRKSLFNFSSTESKLIFQINSSFIFLPEDSFGLRILSSPASVCVCVSLCVNHLLVHVIIRDLFKLGSPNLDQRCFTVVKRTRVPAGSLVKMATDADVDSGRKMALIQSVGVYTWNVLSGKIHWGIRNIQCKIRLRGTFHRCTIAPRKKKWRGCFVFMFCRCRGYLYFFTRVPGIFTGVPALYECSCFVSHFHYCVFHRTLGAQTRQQTC